MKNSTFRRSLLLSALVLAGATSVAHATSNLDFTYYAYGGVYSGPTSFPSGGSGAFLSYFDYTENSDQIVITYLSDVTWSSSAVSLNSGGLYITNGALFTNPNIDITGVTIDPASTDIGSFGASNITFNANNVALDWQNLTFNSDSVLILDLNATAATVPEPAQWALILAGFAGLGAALRARHRGVVIA